jgi:serine/threonine protein kinase
VGDPLSHDRTLGGEAGGPERGALSRERTLGDSGPGGWALSAGDRLAAYEVLERLGRGGMGEVYLVRHVELGKRYALKLVRPDLAASPGFIERFRREARVTADLEHPNVLHADDSGEDAGRFWFRMEYMEGVEAGAFIDGASAEGASGSARSLADLMRAAGGRLNGGFVADTLEQALEGLAFAHSRGVVHRDLKPSNILLTWGDRKDDGPVAKIGDFGLVRIVGEERVRSMAGASMQADLSVEATGDAAAPAAVGAAADAEPDDLALSLVGTYEYMAPEQKRGEPADARSDVYAMGLVAYRMLTGRQGLSLDLPSEVAKEVDPGWDKFVRKALAEEPRRRFADAGEMLHELREFRGGPRPSLTAPRPRRGEEGEATPSRWSSATERWLSRTWNESSERHTLEVAKASKKGPSPNRWEVPVVIAVSIPLAFLAFAGFVTCIERMEKRRPRGSSPSPKSTAMVTATDWRAEGEKRGREWSARMRARSKMFTTDEARRIAEMMTSDYLSERIDEEGRKLFVEGFMKVAVPPYTLPMDEPPRSVLGPEGKLFEEGK